MFATCRRCSRNNSSRRRQMKRYPGKSPAPPRTRRPTAGIFRRQGSSKRGTGSCSTTYVRRSAIALHNAVRDFKETFHFVVDFRTQSLHFREYNDTEEERLVNVRARMFLQIFLHRIADKRSASMLLRVAAYSIQNILLLNDGKSSRRGTALIVKQ